jgi:hypothetical protein
MFDRFPKYHTNILLGDFKAKIGREDIFKPTLGNESLHKISNDYGVSGENLPHLKIPKSKVKSSHSQEMEEGSIVQYSHRIWGTCEISQAD